MIIDNVIEHFESEWDRLFANIFPGEIHYKISEKNIRNLVFFYTIKSKKPFAFAKITTDPREFKALRNEIATLDTLFKSKDKNLLRSIPRPFFKIDTDEGVAIVMSYIDSKGVDSYCKGRFGLGFKREKLAGKVFSNVLDWWKSFLVAVPVEPREPAAILVEKLQRVKELFSNAYPNDAILFDQLCQLEKEVLSIADKVKIGINHGDLWKGNILVDNKGSVYIIDWERSDNCSVLAYDMFLFLTTLYAKGDYYTDMVRNFTDGSNRNEAIKNAIILISKYVDLPIPKLRMLYELFLYEMSVQNLNLYGIHAKYDIEWKRRLECFLDNKTAIFNASF